VDRRSIKKRYLLELHTMKTLIRLAVTGALIAGGSAAFAQNLPSSDNADLWLFVSNGTSSTFAEDTGISIASLKPATFTTGANLVADPQTINVAETAALSSYLAANSSSTLEWTVEAMQYGSTGPAASANRTAGNEIGILATQNTGANAMIFSKVSGWAAGLNNDMQYLIPGYTAGGTVYNWSAGTSTGNVWGSSLSSTGSTNEYGFGPNTSLVSPSSVAAGTAAPVADQEAAYLLTGNGGTGTTQSYALGELQLNNGVLQNVPVPTPIPAALWLFGSGLLGLVGVGRRRNTAV
jgi:hypothetical protein